MSLDTALKYAKFWAKRDGEIAYSKAKAWWLMAESIRYESSILNELALLLLMKYDR